MPSVGTGCACAALAGNIATIQATTIGPRPGTAPTVPAHHFADLNGASLAASGRLDMSAMAAAPARTNTEGMKVSLAVIPARVI